VEASSFNSGSDLAGSDDDWEMKGRGVEDLPDLHRCGVVPVPGDHFPVRETSALEWFRWVA
jgi:hypothetical protein